MKPIVSKYHEVKMLNLLEDLRLIVNKYHVVAPVASRCEQV